MLPQRLKPAVVGKHLSRRWKRCTTQNPISRQSQQIYLAKSMLPQRLKPDPMSLRHR